MAILENKKRTFQMFLGQLEDKVPDVDDITKAKLEHKIKKWYTDVGKIPGIVIEDAKRRRILKDLYPTRPDQEEEKKE